MDISNLFQIQTSSVVISTKYDMQIFKSYYKNFSSQFWMCFELVYESKTMYLNRD